MLRLREVWVKRENFVLIFQKQKVSQKVVKQKKSKKLYKYLNVWKFSLSKLCQIKR